MDEVRMDEVHEFWDLNAGLTNGVQRHHHPRQGMIGRDNADLKSGLRHKRRGLRTDRTHRWCSSPKTAAQARLETAGEQHRAGGKCVQLASVHVKPQSCGGGRQRSPRNPE